MKWRLATAGLIAVAAMVLVGASDNQPAVVLHHAGPCTMAGADENGDMLTPGGVGVAVVVVDNSNKVMLKCKGTEITNLSGQGQTYSGFGCGIDAPSGFYFTNDSRTTISASGRATLTCTYKK